MASFDLVLSGWRSYFQLYHWRSYFSSYKYNSRGSTGNSRWISYCINTKVAPQTRRHFAYDLVFLICEGKFAIRNIFLVIN